MSLSEDIKYRYEKLFFPTNQDWLSCSNIYDIKYNCRCLDKIELNVAILIVKKLLEDNIDYKFDFIENNQYILKLFCDEEDKQIKCDAMCAWSKEMEILAHNQGSPKEFDPKSEQIKIISDKKNLLILFSTFCLLAVNCDEFYEYRNEIIKTYFCIDSSAFINYIRELKAFVTNFNKWNEKQNYFYKHLKLISDVLNLYSQENCDELIDNLLSVLKNKTFKQNYLYVDGTYAIKQCLEKNISVVQSRKMEKLDMVLYDRSIIISYVIDILKVLNNIYSKEAFVEISKQIYNNFNNIVIKQKRHNEEKIKEKLNEFALMLK